MKPHPLSGNEHRERFRSKNESCSRRRFSAPRNRDLFFTEGPWPSSQASAGRLRTFGKRYQDANYPNAGPAENVPLGGRGEGLGGAHRRAVLASYEEKVAVEDVNISLEPGEAGRLHRPQRRRQVDHDQDADRDPGADLGRDSGRRDRAAREAAPERARTSASSSASAASSIGICRCASRSSCCARSTASRATASGRTSRTSRRSSISTASWPRRSVSSRSANGCAATSPPRCCTIRKIVYLDEPTIGLDVVAKEAIRDVHQRGQPRARHDGDPHDARSGRRRTAVPRASSSSTRAR